MRVAVLGAGVIGLTTAWALLERGYKVTIVDRQPSGGLETSFGNGAQLSYAYVAPLASAGILPKLPSLLFARDGPIKVRPTLDIDFIRWGLGFLKACNASMEDRTTLAQLALAGLSRSEIGQLTSTLGLQFGLAEPGKLVVFRSDASFAAARRQAGRLAAVAINQEIASPERCLELEPALRMTPSDLKGGVFTPTDQVGDCALFCEELAGHVSRHPNATWRMGETISSPAMERDRLRAVKTHAGEIEADTFVLCLASGSSRFARAAGFYLPIQPMKGYSLTATPAANAHPLTRSVTDFDNKIVFAPVHRGNAAKLRIAGIADLVGADLRLDQQRITSIRRLADVALDLDHSDGDEPWAGLRPATPDSRPIIGWSPVGNLFLNTGHGGLGWTLACGSARLTADLIQGVQPSIPPALFALSRS